MSRVLVVESSHEQRAAIVDALCELPNVDVRGDAHDLTAALRSLVEEPADVIVAGTSRVADIVALLAVARECRLDDVVIHAPTADDEASSLWLACGASHVVVGSIDELAETVGSVARERAEAPSHPTPDDPGEVLPERVTFAAATSLASTRAATSREIVDVADVLRDAFQAFHRVLPDDIEVIVESATGTPPVRCVPKDIERLALGLVLSAIANMPWGGKVWLIVEPHGDHHVRIEVIDTGSGLRTQTSDGVKVAASRREPADRARLRELETIVERQHGSLYLGRSDDGRERLEIVFPAA